jgi:hypothetical protein
MPANIEAADPQGVPRYLASSSEGKTASDPARIFHDIESKNCLSAPIIAGAGTTVVVPGIAGKSIRPTAISLSASAACEVAFKSNTANRTGVYYLAARTPLTLSATTGLFDCTSGEDLRIEVTGGVTIGGLASYRLVD